MTVDGVAIEAPEHGTSLPDRRAFAYGLFTGIYGTAWVAGSILIGVLADISLGGLVAFCIVTELAAIPLILMVRRQMTTAR